MDESQTIRMIRSLGWVIAISVAAGCLADDVSDASNSGSSGEFPSDDSGAMDAPPLDVAGLDCDGARPWPRALRLLTRAEYAATVADLLGATDLEIDVIPVEPRVDGFNNNLTRSVVTPRHVDAYLDLAEEITSEAFAGDGPTLIGCMPADPGCATDFIRRFGQKLFRRPLTDEEVNSLLRQFDDALTQSDFYEGARLTVRAMLISPHFLYRSELGEARDDGLFELTPYEIATWLAYTYWGTTPDDTLLDAAASDGLETSEQIVAQAERLLDDPRGRAHFSHFVSQWLGTDGLPDAVKDPAFYPRFNNLVREAMIAEQRALFDHVVWESDGTVDELLLTRTVFVNDTLADYYGLPRPGHDDVVRVELSDDDPRGGLLRLGSVLATHAHAMDSGPIQRGAFVRERLMCQDLPAIPANLDTTPPPVDPQATTRERFEQHTADPQCAGCHQFIDDVGFVFEAFDGAGGYRDQENGLPIETFGSLVGITSLADPARVDLDDPGDLAQALVDNDVVGPCLVQQRYRFISGRINDSGDACLLTELVAQYHSDRSIRELLLQPARMDALRLRGSE